MEQPNLDLIVETFICIRAHNADEYMSQLREELIPEIRKLQSEGKIIWYGFLIHENKNLGLCIHLRLSLPEGADVDQLIRQLPAHFQETRKSSLSAIGNIDASIMKDQNWVYAWKVHGEASEWILRMLEAHAQNAAIPIQQIIQFMHYITNPLMIGHKCRFILPDGFISF